MESLSNSEAETTRRSLGRWRRRWMWAVAYYPMVVLLGVTLFCIRVTDASEIGYWFLLGLFSICAAVVFGLKWADARLLVP